MRQRYPEVYDILIIMFIYEAILQLRFAKCQVVLKTLDGNSTSAGNLVFNNTTTALQNDTIYSSMSKIIQTVKNNVDPQNLLDQNPHNLPHKHSQTNVELENSDKVSTKFDSNKSNYSSSRTNGSHQTIKDSISAQPTVTVDVWGEEWTRKSAADKQSKNERERSRVNKELSSDSNTRTQKQLNFPDSLPESSTEFSRKFDESPKTKTWALTDKHSSSLPSFESELNDSLFKMTTPSSKESSFGETSTESSDVGDVSPIFPSVDILQAGFKPLSKYIDDDNSFESMPAIPLANKEQRVKKSRTRAKSTHQSFSPQYSAWKSEIVGTKPSNIHSQDTIRDMPNHKSNYGNSFEYQVDGTEEDSADTRKSWNSGVHLQRVNPAYPQRLHHHSHQLQPINGILRSADRGANTGLRLEPNAVFLGSATSSAPAYGARSSAADWTSKSQQDLQNQPQTIQITAVPNGRLATNPLVRLNALNQLNALGFNNGLLPGNVFAGGSGGLGLDALGRQIVMVNAERRQIDWSFWIWPLIALISLPLVLGALFVPIFLKSIVILIQVLQSLGLLLPFSLTQQLAQAATGVLAASTVSQVDQVTKT